MYSIRLCDVDTAFLLRGRDLRHCEFRQLTLGKLASGDCHGHSHAQDGDAAKLTEIYDGISYITLNLYLINSTGR